jgi:S-adenosylmethionine synthetase
MLQYITSESVTSGHPDKICDQISDSILDACLQQDPYSRVACECLAASENLVIAWEITTKARVDYVEIAKKTIKEIWYDNDESYYNADKIKYLNFVNTQSQDIAAWVDTWWAWDQWIMYGYATNETKRFMPLPIDIAHALWEKLEKVRKTWEIDYILPDWKTQVTVIYDENLNAVWIDTVLISTQHKVWTDQKILKEDLIKKVITPILADFGYDIKDVTNIYTNPTWIFNVGWPVWDSWLTWRKIIVDTYGWVWRHGWGAFSWKDPTKVDRSGAYIARYLAKNIVASWVCDRCEIQLSYAIWMANPISIYVNTFGTNKISEEKIINALKENFDLSPGWIIKKLDLRRAIYKKTATYGHFWRGEFSWENLDSVDIFKNLK